MENKRKNFWLAFLQETKSFIANKIRSGPRHFQKANPSIESNLIEKLSIQLDAIITPTIVSYINKSKNHSNKYQDLFSGQWTEILEKLLCDHSISIEKIYQNLFRFRSNLETTFERIYRDWHKICLVFDIAERDFLSEVNFCAGDFHGYANCTSLFIFNGGKKGFVYKPTNIKVDAFLQELKGYICNKDANASSSIKVLDASIEDPHLNYGYIEYIENNSNARNISEVKKSYEEFGKLLAFGKIFNISDGHYENIIVNVPKVHWIDLEIGFNFLEASEVNHPLERTGLLFEAGELNTVLGIPTGIQSGIIPKLVITKPSVVDDGTDKMSIRYFRLASPSTSNRIFYRGISCRLEKFLASIRSGYRFFFEEAFRKKSNIMDLCNEKFSAAEIRVRHLFQLTACYARYIALLNHCQSNLCRNTLAQIRKERIKTFHASEENARDFILSNELNDISNGVIPYFYRSSKSRSIYHLSGAFQANFSPNNLVDEVQNSLNEISLTSVKEDLKFINKAIFSTSQITSWQDFKHRFNPPVYCNQRI